MPPSSFVRKLHRGTSGLVFGASKLAGEMRLIVSNCVATSESVIDKIDTLRISTLLVVSANPSQ